jgi:subfamily B ATP-binding cassette protein MsbA
MDFLSDSLNIVPIAKPSGRQDAIINPQQFAQPTIAVSPVRPPSLANRMAQFVRQLWQFLRPHQRRLWLGVVAGLLYAIGSGLLLLAVKLVFDALFPTEGARQLEAQLAKLPGFLSFVSEPILQAFAALRADRHSAQLLWVIAAVPFAMTIRGLGTYFSFYLMNWVGTATVHDLRVKLFSHLQRLSLDFFGSARTGDLISRLTNDTQAIQGVVATGFTTLAKEPATVVVILGYLLMAQRQLTLISLVVFPLVLVPIIIYGRKVRKSWGAAQTHTAELSDVMQEAFTGARVVKAYNLEGAVTERFAGTSRKIAGQFMRFVRASELPGPMIEIFGAIGVALLLLYVARGNQRAGPTAGDFTSFVGALFSLYQPVKNLSKLWSQLEQGRGAGERLFGLLAMQPTVAEPKTPRPLRAAQADIEFSNVGFGYGEKPAVQNLTLSVKAGQLVALVGASGSGKTTLTNLLLRFYDPQQGAVRIGGLDLREVATADLRAQIAVVTQETILFNDSIRANIRLGRPNATDAEVEAAARAANAHEFIVAKEGGYNFVIGERGGSLSGGQRQRLAIARAILKNAPVLVLDEATSALDTESERAVQTALETLMRGRTTLCIAHRLSTIQHADVIVVMAEGRIVESGKHAELLARNGTYAKLHALQFGATVPS